MSRLLVLKKTETLNDEVVAMGSDLEKVDAAAAVLERLGLVEQ